MSNTGSEIRGCIEQALCELEVSNLQKASLGCPLHKRWNKKNPKEGCGMVYKCVSSQPSHPPDMPHHLAWVEKLCGIRALARRHPNPPAERGPEDPPPKKNRRVGCVNVWALKQGIHQICPTVQLEWRGCGTSNTQSFYRKWIRNNRNQF